MYNAAATVVALVHDIERLEVDGGHEIILANDGGQVNTMEVCRQLARTVLVPLTVIEHARELRRAQCRADRLAPRAGRAQAYGFGWPMSAFVIFSGTQLVMPGLIGGISGAHVPDRQPAASGRRARDSGPQRNTDRHGSSGPQKNTDRHG
jgi:hypothetical protein